VSVPLLVDRELLAQIDAAARTMGVDRQTVLLRSFGLLTYATGTLLGHEQHPILGGVL
jgi:hypothetical protein